MRLFFPFKVLIRRFGFKFNSFFYKIRNFFPLNNFMRYNFKLIELVNFEYDEIKKKT